MSLSRSLLSWKGLLGRSAVTRFLFALLLLAPLSAPAAFSGYLKIPDIDGESTDPGHEDEIEILGMSFSITHSEGGGRTTGAPTFSALRVQKLYDASSPYLALACAQRSRLQTVTLVSDKRLLDGSRVEYLLIELQNVVVSSYSVSTPAGSMIPQDEVGLSFESIRIRYIQTADDHSTGDEHEIEYDIVAGV